MSMTPEAPMADVAVSYELEGSALTVRASIGDADVSVTLDWAEGADADPGADLDTLLAVLPNIILAVNEDIKENE